MRWLIAAALLVGGCAQIDQGIGLTTGSITSLLGGGATTPVPPATDTATQPTAAQLAATKPAMAKASTGTIAGAERISGNLFRIQADGRRITDHVERENYTLLRAAETTRAQGATHFVLVSAGDQATTGVPSLKMLVSGDSNAEYGAYFRVLRIEPDATAPIGAMSADEIIHFFGAKFGRPAE